jgi:hypothetical protein
MTYRSGRNPVNSQRDSDLRPEEDGVEAPTPRDHDEGTPFLLELQDRNGTERFVTGRFCTRTTTYRASGKHASDCENSRVQ